MSAAGDGRARGWALLALAVMAGACGDDPPIPPADVDRLPVRVVVTVPGGARVEASATGADGRLGVREGGVHEPVTLDFLDADGDPVPATGSRTAVVASSDDDVVAVESSGAAAYRVEAGAVGSAELRVRFVDTGTAPPDTLFGASVPVDVGPTVAGLRLIAGADTVGVGADGTTGSLELVEGESTAVELELLDADGSPTATLGGEGLEVVASEPADVVAAVVAGGGLEVSGLRFGTGRLRARFEEAGTGRAFDADVPVTVVRPPCTGPGGHGICLREVARELDKPALFTPSPVTGDRRLFLVRTVGVIEILHADGRWTRFLDMVDRVKFGPEQGLLGLAFHPGYATNGTFFVYYKALDGNMLLDRMTVRADDPDLADPDSRETILTVEHPVERGLHNAGHMFFGPDGHLWVTAGDGGDDPALEVPTDVTDLRGSILRLDPAPAPEPAGYRIPPGNPFADGADGARPEIYHYGLRNPWRIEIDEQRRLLFVADVGETRLEELDVVPLDTAGVNFGWNAMEGTRCRRSDCTAIRDSTTLPIYEYDHDQGAAIIGGYVYRGAAIPGLQGRYFFADHLGFLRSMRVEDGVASDVVEHLANSALFEDTANPGLVNAFGRDADGEMYLLMWGGRIYRIEPAP